MSMLNGRSLRETILRQSRRANTGHIGSCLSIADLLVALLRCGANFGHRELEDRDRLILSKGHSALALYSSLYLLGHISLDELDTYCADGTLLGVHPERDMPFIDFSTGSLGHGLSLGAGAALAAKLKRSDRHIYVLMSDAELNEGSVWEAALFSAHHKLSNLTAIVDVNGQQALGKTAEVMDTEPLVDKWLSFRWNVIEVDGHDENALERALTTRTESVPTIVLARTTFGKGVDYMESSIDWHYLPMNEEQFARALEQVSG